MYLSFLHITDIFFKIFKLNLKSQVIVYCIFRHTYKLYIILILILLVLESLIVGLKGVDTAKANVATSITALDTAMSNLATGIENTFTSCGAPCSSSKPSTAALAAGTNFDPNLVSRSSF